MCSVYTLSVLSLWSLFFWVCFPLQLSPSVLWYCWLGLLTCKNRLPYNLYCVGGDVKRCTIQSICGERFLNTQVDQIFWSTLTVTLVVHRYSELCNDCIVGFLSAGYVLAECCNLELIVVSVQLCLCRQTSYGTYQLCPCWEKICTISMTFMCSVSISWN